MPCIPFQVKDAAGNVVGAGFACTRGRKPKRCEVCKERPSTVLCDYPLHGAKEGETCSKACCDRCAVRMGNDRDYCATHHRQLITWATAMKADLGS